MEEENKYLLIVWLAFKENHQSSSGHAATIVPIGIEFEMLMKLALSCDTDNTLGNEGEMEMQRRQVYRQ